MNRYDYYMDIENDIRNYLKTNDYGYIDDDLLDHIDYEIRSYTRLCNKAADEYYAATSQDAYDKIREEIEEHLCHNMHLVQSACNVMGIHIDHDDALEKDKAIREYLLTDCLRYIVDTEHNTKFKKGRKNVQ